MEEVIAALKEDEESLIGGIMAWIVSLSPMSKSQAEGLKTCESVLRQALADVPKYQPVLEMLQAIRRDAMGDKQALLNLPLELRRLIRPDA